MKQALFSARMITDGRAFKTVIDTDQKELVNLPTGSASAAEVRDAGQELAAFFLDLREPWASLPAVSAPGTRW